MLIDMKMAKVAAGNGAKASVLALLCRLFAKTRCRFNEGRPTVATPVRTLADMVEVSYASVSRAISSLEEAGLVRVTRKRWNRSLRLYINVPKATYETLGLCPPDNCAFYEGSGEPAFIGEFHVTTCNMKNPSVQHDTSQDATCHVTECNVLDLQSEDKSKKQSMPPADAGGSASPDGSAVMPEISGEAVSGGKMSGLKARAEKTVAQAVISKADAASIPVAAVYARAMKGAGYACAPDEKFKGNVTTLKKKMAARGLDLRKEAKALVERWAEYRGPESAKRPEPWAVAKRLDAYCALSALAPAPKNPPPPPPQLPVSKAPQSPPEAHQSIFLKAMKEKKE